VARKPVRAQDEDVVGLRAQLRQIRLHDRAHAEGAGQDVAVGMLAGCGVRPQPTSLRSRRPIWSRLVARG
jgi:hypothetical protein